MPLIAAGESRRACWVQSDEYCGGESSTGQVFRFRALALGVTNIFGIAEDFSDGERKVGKDARMTRKNGGGRLNTFRLNE